MSSVNGMSKELAPLEVLQSSQHRRGSITDPSLHTASSYHLKAIMNHPLDPKSALQDARPSPSYVFGNATPRPQTPGSVADHSKTPSGGHSHDKSEVLSEGDDALSDSHSHPYPNSYRDHDSRRSSLAPNSSPGLAGTKRKLSTDRGGLSPFNGPIEMPHGSSSFDSDPELRPVKRRGSAVDTHKISMLSLDDRRGSIDSRMPGQWWSGASQHDERRSQWQPSHSDGGLFSHDPMLPSQDRRMSVPDIRPLTTTTSRVARARSRPPDVLSPEEMHAQRLAKDSNISSYSRSPELRVSHKLAERKRRAEMKDLFEDLKDQLPAERGMKASKWEILSKAIDLVVHLKNTNASQAEEIEALKRELAQARAQSFRSLDPSPTLPQTNARASASQMLRNASPTIEESTNCDGMAG